MFWSFGLFTKHRINHFSELAVGQGSLCLWPGNFFLDIEHQLFGTFEARLKFEYQKFELADFFS